MTNEQGIVAVIGELRSSLEHERDKVLKLEAINSQLALDLKVTKDELAKTINELTRAQTVVSNMRVKYETQRIERETN